MEASAVLVRRSSSHGEPWKALHWDSLLTAGPKTGRNCASDLHAQLRQMACHRVGQSKSGLGVATLRHCRKLWEWPAQPGPGGSPLSCAGRCLGKKGAVLLQQPSPVERRAQGLSGQGAWPERVGMPTGDRGVFLICLEGPWVS